MQHVAAADRPAGHSGDHNLGDRANHFLQVEHIETRHHVRAYIAADAAHALVAAATKSFASLSGEYDDLNAHVLTADVHGIDHLLHSQRRKGIVFVRAVDADFSDAVI